MFSFRKKKLDQVHAIYKVVFIVKWLKPVALNMNLALLTVKRTTEGSIIHLLKSNFNVCFFTLKTQWIMLANWECWECVFFLRKMSFFKLLNAWSD